MKLHADGDMLLQRLHCGGKVVVLRGAGYRQMKLEVGILTMRLAIGRIAHQLQGVANGEKAFSIVPDGGGGRRCRLKGKAKFVTIQKVGNVFKLAEAERLAQTRGSDKTPGATPRIDQALVAQAFQRLA